MTTDPAEKCSEDVEDDPLNRCGCFCDVFSGKQALFMFLEDYKV